MADCTTYERATGRLIAQISCPDGRELIQETATLGVVMDHHDPAAMRVLDGDVVPRDPLPIKVSKAAIVADDKDEAVLTGFPAGAEVSIDGETYAVQTGVLQITSPMPSTYTITCRHWPHLDWETTIEAVAP